MSGDTMTGFQTFTINSNDGRYGLRHGGLYMRDDEEEENAE